jgi:methyl-accepting chemotaxis protein
VSNRISAGVGTVEDTASSLERIVKSVEDADSGVQEINRSTTSQAESSQQVVDMIDEVAGISATTDDRSTDVTEAARAQSKSIESISERIDSLSRGAETLLEILEDTEVSEDIEPQANGNPSRQIRGGADD